MPLKKHCHGPIAASTEAYQPLYSSLGSLTVFEGILSYQSISEHTHDVTISNHTHDVNYDINLKSYTTTDIRIYTTNDADGTPAWTERTAAIETALGRALNSSDEEIETNLNLTSFFSGTGFKGVRIVTNGNSRHKAQILGKVFIESKTVS